MLSESELRFVIEGGENTTVEFKVSTPRPGELAERLCGMANSQVVFDLIRKSEVLII